MKQIQTNICNLYFEMLHGNDKTHSGFQANLPTAALKRPQDPNTQEQKSVSTTETILHNWTTGFNLLSSLFHHLSASFFSALWVSIMHPLSQASPLPSTQFPALSPFTLRPLGTGVGSLWVPYYLCVLFILSIRGLNSFLSLCQARWDVPAFPMNSLHQTFVVQRTSLCLR